MPLIAVLITTGLLSVGSNTRLMSAPGTKLGMTAIYTS
jgi:hypothetical protein